MAIAQNYKVDFADIKQIYSNLNAVHSETDLWGRPDFGFSKVSVDLQDKLAKATDVNLLSLFIKEMGANAFLAGIATGLPSDVESSKLILPGFLQELDNQVDQINKTCPYDGDVYSFGTNFTNVSGFFTSNNTFFSNVFFTPSYGSNFSTFFNSAFFTANDSCFGGFFGSNNSNVSGFFNSCFSGINSSGFNASAFFTSNNSCFGGFFGSNNSNFSGVNGTFFTTNFAFKASSFFGSNFNNFTFFFPSSFNFTNNSFNPFRSNATCFDGWEAFGSGFAKNQACFAGFNTTFNSNVN